VAKQQIVSLSHPDEIQRNALSSACTHIGFPKEVSSCKNNQILIVSTTNSQSERGMSDPLLDETTSSAIQVLMISVGTNDQLSDAAYQWIARVRNQGTIRLVAIPEASRSAHVNPGGPLWVEQLQALGFLKCRADTTKGTSDWILYFDIRQYKETPDWLNPRNWAHPERWNKYRW
jgi:hypothetical protein